NAAELTAKYEQLGAAGAQLSTRLDEAKAAVDGQKAAVQEASGAQAQLARSIEQAANAYKSTLAQVKASKEPNEALKNQLRDQRDALISLIEQETRAKVQLGEQTEALAKAETAFASVNTEVAANSKAQEKLGRDTQAANEAAARQAETLEKARAELASMTAAGEAAGQKLGG